MGKVRREYVAILRFRSIDHRGSKRCSGVHDGLIGSGRGVDDEYPEEFIRKLKLSLDEGAPKFALLHVEVRQRHVEFTLLLDHQNHGHFSGIDGLIVRSSWD